MKNFRIISVIALVSISLLYSCGNNTSKESEQTASVVSIDEFKSAPEGKSQYGCIYALSEERMTAGNYICCESEDGGILLNINGVTTKFKYDNTKEKYINDNFELTLPIIPDGMAGEPGTGTIELFDKSGNTIKKEVYFEFNLP